MVANPRTRSGRWAALLPLAALVGVAGCKDAAAPGAEFIITPDAATILIGQAKQLTAIGAPGPVTWSSSSSQVATVVPETGFVRAISRGEATISAVSGSSVATAQIAVRVPAALGLSAPTADFAVTIGQADPAAQTVTVRNTGDGGIPGIGLGQIAYGAGQPQGWLTAAASGSDAPVTITLTARRGTLPRGVYTATLPVTAPNIDNSPQSLAVSFRVNAPPAIAASRTTVPMAGIPASTVTETVAITNGGDLTLSGLAAAVTYGAGQPQGWLQPTFSATTAPATLTLRANTAGLAVGNYNATVRVSSSVTGVAPLDLAITLAVSPGPAIQLSRTSVPVQATNGVNATAQTVDISNGGGGSLTSLTLGTVQYGAGQPQGWLNPVLGSTTAPATLTLNFATAALASGSYSATLPVQSSVASNSPVNITVSLTVGPPPAIAVNPANVLFATWRGAPSLPSLQGVQVTNSGGGTLSGLSFSVAYTAGPAGWLNASWQGGVTTAPATLLFNPNTTNLVEGTHTATVTISSTIAGVASRTVTVSYSIQSFTLHVYPLFSSLGCTGCHAGGQPPNLSGSAQAVYNAIIGGGYVTPGSPSGSLIACKAYGACGHTGGKSPSLQGPMNSWILAGAPFQ